jgi:gliding motility-associated-like protein
VIRATEYGVHTVLITTPEGCSIEDRTLVVEYCPSTIHLPNGFTPNGDGVNDLFLPVGTNIATVELSIFDRWGRLIHRGRDADAFWDGTMDGAFVKDGVYVWKVICRFHLDASRTLAGPEEERIGHVTVLR